MAANTPVWHTGLHEHHHNKKHGKSGKFHKKLCVSQSSLSHADRLSLLFHPVTQSSRCWDEIMDKVRWKQLAPAHRESPKVQHESCTTQEMLHRVCSQCQLALKARRRLLFYRFINPFSFRWSSLRAGCETSLKPRCPGCPSPLKHCMTLPTWTFDRQWLIWI